MSFNAFESVSADETTVTVTGHTNKLSTPTHIDVAVVAADDDDRRLQGVARNPGSTPWHATLDQSGLDEPFKPGEKVLLVGASRDTEDRLELWTGIVDEKVPGVQCVATIEPA